MDGLYRDALKLWGEDAQIKMAVEEMAELTNALMKFDRNRVDTSAVAEEIADVMIMAEQMALIFGGRQYVQQIREKKLLRLAKVIGKAKQRENYEL